MCTQGREVALDLGKGKKCSQKPTRMQPSVMVGDDLMCTDNTHRCTFGSVSERKKPGGHIEWRTNDCRHLEWSAVVLKHFLVKV